MATTPTDCCCHDKMNVLLSTTYFGPVQWYQKLYRADKAWIERHETFQKQTYRNRCVIATTQGTQALTVPVERGNSQLIKDIRISDHGNWRHLHWNALVSSYHRTPFFEFYADDFAPFYEKKYEFLFDFNQSLQALVGNLLEMPATVQRGLQGEPYYQIFASRHGFLPDLSIVDLLFNMGPESIFYLFPKQ